MIVWRRSNQFCNNTCQTPSFEPFTIAKDVQNTSTQSPGRASTNDQVSRPFQNCFPYVLRLSLQKGTDLLILITLSNTEPHELQPHPAAPSEIADQFSSFKKTLESGPHFDPNKLKDFKLLAAETATPVGAENPQGPVGTGALDPSKVGSSSSIQGSSGGNTSSPRGDVAEDLHDLPPRFWKTPTLILEEVEMDAIMVSTQASCLHS